MPEFPETITGFRGAFLASDLLLPKKFLIAAILPVRTRYPIKSAINMIVI
nr:hypothetical protein [Mucilaginibacter sp. FT3.2]